MIIEKSNVDKVKVESIKIGNCFKSDDDCICIATDERDSETKEVMCVDLNTGVSILFAADEDVTPITARVVVENA